MEPKSDSEGSSHIAAQILSAGFLKSLQIFYFVFGIGALLLLFFVLFQSVSVGDIPLAVDDGVARLLSLVHLAYGMAAYGVSPVLFRRILARGISGGHTDRFVAALRSAYILRLTIFEGVAYFGLVVLLISATDGVLMLFPQYWINLLSTLVLMVFIPTTFPTRERLQSHIEGHASAR
jgi:hypothetical protein